MKAKILVIEDEPDMAMGLRDNLEFEGYKVIHASTGEDGLDLARRESPQCILLDVMLPGADGFEICRQLRQRGTRCPILMLTARGLEIDKVRGLELGADDYVTKPFGVKELIARIHASLRRSSLSGGASDVTIGKVRVSFLTGRIVKGEKELPLGHYECQILKTLWARPGEIVTRKELLSEIWGLENEPMNRSVDNHVVSLRRKIEDDPAVPRHLLTVHGFGYKLVP